jgi:hypothetical protein
MNGIEIEYLWGIYFVVVSLSWERSAPNQGRIVIDFVKMIAGVVLLVLAVIGKSFIGG